MKRWLPAVAVAAVLATVLSGCVAIVFQSSEQLNVIGSVRLNTGVCLGGSPGDCPSTNNSNSEPTGDMQLLAGYRVPTNTQPPATFGATETSTGEALTFSRSDSYASELERLSPAATGQRWVGYVSSVHHHDASTNSRETFSLQTDFALTQGADGSPYRGPFAYRTVVGRRTVNPGGAPPQPGDRAVKCGGSLTSPNMTDAGEQGTVCADSPSPKTIATNRNQPTRDLAVQCQGPNRVPAGKEGPINFNLLYAGASGPEATFAIAATTTAPGATVTPGQTSVSPATDSITGVGTTVKVPVSTPPGVYDVTLTASVSGQQRSNHCALTVAASPAAKVGLLGVHTACVSRPFTARVNVTRAGVSSARVLLDGKQIASSTSARFDVRIDPRRLRPGRHTIETVVTDAAGRTTRRVTSFRVCAALKPAPVPRRAPGFTG